MVDKTGKVVSKFSSISRWNHMITYDIIWYDPYLKDIGDKVEMNFEVWNQDIFR